MSWRLLLLQEGRAPEQLLDGWWTWRGYGKPSLHVKIHLRAVAIPSRCLQAGTPSLSSGSSGSALRCARAREDNNHHRNDDGIIVVSLTVGDLVTGVVEEMPELKEQLKEMNAKVEDMKAELGHKK